MFLMFCVVVINNNNDISMQYVILNNYLHRNYLQKKISVMHNIKHSILKNKHCRIKVHKGHVKS